MRARGREPLERGERDRNGKMIAGSKQKTAKQQRKTQRIGRRTARQPDTSVCRAGCIDAWLVASTAGETQNHTMTQITAATHVYFLMLLVVMSAMTTIGRLSSLAPK